MATLNTSSEGGAITRSYQTIVSGQLPSGSSPTYGQWVVLHVSAPLASAFQSDTGKESVLKVQATGEGELVDMLDEFNDGRIQFGFVKVKDPNSGLPKSVLIAWCGEGVPERTKGYFTTHTAAVSKLLHGYHVQITARTDSQLDPDSIVRKVADSSGSKYAGDTTSKSSSGGPPPPTASKPVFTPSRVGGAAGGFKPLGASTTRQALTHGNEDDDGWGADAPQVSRSQLQKVESAYKPTKVNMRELTSQKSEPPRFNGTQATSSPAPDVVRGAYQPIGKVDIAAIRRQAQESGSVQDDRPTIVKGAYEPVGKVDIAAIRAKAQGPGSSSSPSAISPAQTGTSSQGGETESAPKSLADRSAAFTQSERMTSLPKPKVGNKFGSSNFAGTKAPVPGVYGGQPSKPAPVGAVSKTFADEGGKTPAQLWAERKAREKGSSGAMDATTPSTIPISSQTSGGGEWSSGYSGKKWGSVQTARLGQTTITGQHTGDDAAEEQEAMPSGGVSSIRDRFKGAAPMGAPVDTPTSAPPPMDLSSKPNANTTRGVPMPGFASKETEASDLTDDVPAEEERYMPPPPAQPPRTPTPDEEPQSRPSSPIRLAQPVARTQETEIAAPPERNFEPPIPTNSISRSVPQPQDLEDEPQVAEQDLARAASQAAAESTLGHKADAHGDQQGGKTARAEYDYEKAEDNEIGFEEGELITNIDMVDEDWWMGTNSKGESGLFPANYVTLAESSVAEETAHPPPSSSTPSHTTTSAAPAAAPAAAASAKADKPTATAEYDYEAAEENELSFPEGATITDIEFPDEDWWAGSYNGREGLFPANYVTLNQSA